MNLIQMVDVAAALVDEDKISSPILSFCPSLNLNS